MCFAASNYKESNEYVLGFSYDMVTTLIPEGLMFNKIAGRNKEVGRDYHFVSKEKDKYLHFMVGVYPEETTLQKSVNQYLTQVCSTPFKESVGADIKVGDRFWVVQHSEGNIYFSRNNVFVCLIGNAGDNLQLAKHIDDLIINQKSPFKYSKTSPSAPFPEIPKQIKNNAAAWKTLFKDYSGRYEVVTNGQAIYRKDPENNKETFELARKTGKVKLTINIVTDDNLFDTKEVETELVP